MICEFVVYGCRNCTLRQFISFTWFMWRKTPIHILKYTSSHVLSISRTNTTTTTSTHNLGTQFIFFGKRQDYYSVPVAWREMHLCFLVYLLELIHGRWGNHTITPLQCRHNERDSVSNHQPHDCLLNRTFRRRSKKTPKLRVTGLCAGNSPGTDEFPAQMASNAENVSIWWRHHANTSEAIPKDIDKWLDWI